MKISQRKKLGLPTAAQGQNLTHAPQHDWRDAKLLPRAFKQY
jgi:hypothetical protein